MRGKGSAPRLAFCHVGITPAHAGKSSPAGNCRSAWWDHPRVCGEKLNLSTPSGTTIGSPPHMRGKVVPRYVEDWLDRITPAYAGKRRTLQYVGPNYQDHPRVCGEKPVCRAFGISLEGSPPRMRGKVGLTGGPGCGSRITPAYAGKSHQGGIVFAIQ